MEEQRKQDEIRAARRKPNWFAVLRGDWEAEPLGQTWQHPLLTAVAAVVALVLAEALHMREVYWAAISAAVVTQQDVVLTISAARDRFVGTAVGAVMGWLAAWIWHGNVLVFGLAMAISLTACGVLGLKSARRLCGANDLPGNTGPGRRSEMENGNRSLRRGVIRCCHRGRDFAPAGPLHKISRSKTSVGLRIG